MLASELGWVGDSSPGAREPAASRVVIYRVLSSMFLDPTDERLRVLVSAVPELRRRTRPVRGLAFFGSWDVFLSRLEALTDDDLERLRQEHTRLFVSGVETTSSRPFASAHLELEAHQLGSEGSRAQADYAEAGLSPAFGSGPPDHISVELDFLAWLCRREAEASDEGEAAGWRERQHRFATRRMMGWLPSFARGLEEHAPQGLLAVAGRVAAAFVEHDVGLLDAMGAGSSERS
jgi:TorA maturation chaperone TorD